MLILLIIPNYNRSVKNFDPFMPLGIPYVASIIEKCGYEVEVLNLNFVDGTGKNEILEKLLSKKYDIVGTGGTIFDFCSIERIFSVVNKFDANIIKLLGGRLLLYDTELVFNSLGANYGVVGDADITLPLLLEKINQKSDVIIDNIIFKQDGQTILTTITPNKNLIDVMPYPNILKCGYETIYANQRGDALQYSYFSEKEWKIYSIVPTFNCTHNCTFCANGKLHYRTRTEESIAQEMDSAVEHYGIDLFDFTADIFSVHWNDVAKLCSDINTLRLKYNKEIRFVISMRMNGFTLEKATLLKQSGCIGVFFGFDSYDDRVLKSMRKGITSKDVENAVQVCKSIHLVYSGCFIFGDVAETKESYHRTLNFWKDHCKGFVAITPIVILPGAQLMDYAWEKGIVTDKIEFYKELSAKRDYFLLSKKLSPLMTEREHRKMLNTILSYSVKYQFFAKCKAKKTEKQYEIHYYCKNCSSQNNRKEVILQYGIYSWVVCPECGATNFVHRLPRFLLNAGIYILSIIMKYVGIQIFRLKYKLTGH